MGLTPAHVTIALPCYNRELGLGKTIRSLMELHYPKNLLQFIIVDDCSTDRTLAEAKWIQKKHPEYDILVLEHPKNRGKAAAVNTALESLAFRILDDHVNHCVAGALASGDPVEAETKSKELLEAVHRFARVR